MNVYAWVINKKIKKIELKKPPIDAVYGSGLRCIPMNVTAVLGDERLRNMLTQEIMRHIIWARGACMPKRDPLRPLIMELFFKQEEEQDANDL
jgi:hypothetical protein